MTVMYEDPVSVSDQTVTVEKVQVFFGIRSRDRR
jgi:hypothetical protein